MSFLGIGGLVLVLLGIDEPDATRSYRCGRATSSITIDGKLDDPAWSAAEWTATFVDIEGSRRPRPRFRTRAKMLWDDRYFYLAAELEEPHVWGTLREHDSVIFHDNDFEVFLDPDGDHHEYYEIEINALNTEWDLFLPRPYRDGGPAVNAWEIPGLKTAVSVNGTLNDPSDEDHGWSVEMAIPWSVLGEYANRPAPPRDGDVWRVNFSRVEWHHEVVGGRYRKVSGLREDNWVWSPQGVIDMHRPERWGLVRFVADPSRDSPRRPEMETAARNRLMDVYAAQRAFREQHGRWAASLEELGLRPAEGEAASWPLSLRAVEGGFEAVLEAPSPDGPPRCWSVRQDSRLRQIGS